VIAARCHGNNVVNLWKGNSLVNNPTAKGFQNSFSGTSGNIHISWLAKYGLDNGKIYNATFVAELGESSTNNFGSNYSNPLYANWPDLNSGWPNLTTTRIQGLTVATNGEVCILGLGRRTFTTANAFQRMPNPRSPAKGTWNNFVRVYSADLSNVLYSSLLTGAWDTTSGAGGDNTTLTGVYPINKNILVTGSIRKSGNRIPRSEPVSWADSTLNGPKAVFAQLPLAELPAVTRVSKPEKSKSGIVFFPNPTQGKVRWIAGDQTRTTETNGLWEIFNVLGEKVRSSKPESDPDHLDLSGLPAGLYRITDGKGGSGSVLFQPSL
jgi:hypothetical protein